MKFNNRSVIDTPHQVMITFVYKIIAPKYALCGYYLVISLHTVPIMDNSHYL